MEMYAKEIGRISADPYGAALTTPKGVAPPAGVAPSSWGESGVDWAGVVAPVGALIGLVAVLEVGARRLRRFESKTQTMAAATPRLENA